MADHALDAVAVQFLAVPLHPRPCLLIVRAVPGNQRPEFCAVVHIRKMGDFMCGYIVKHEGGRQDQPPRIGKLAIGRTRPPPAGLIAHGNSVKCHGHRLGIGRTCCNKLLLAFCLKPVAKSAAKVHRIACHLDISRSACLLLHQPHSAAQCFRVADFMRNASQRYDRAWCERNGLGNGRKPRADPL